MNQMMKKAMGLALAAILVFAMAACGGSEMLELDKVRGEWMVSTVNGADFNEYCAANGLDPMLAQSIWNITSEESATVVGNGQTAEYKLRFVEGGFVVLNEAGEDWMGVKYDEGANTLTYKIALEDHEFTYVLIPTDAAEMGLEDGEEASAEEADEYEEDEETEEE